MLQDARIIRHELKIKATIQNVQKFLKIKEEYGSFNAFIWQYVDHLPIINDWKEPADVPSSTSLSAKISAHLVNRGFKFVGPKIIYSFMQASGIVNDHLAGCMSKDCSDFNHIKQ